MIKKPLFENIIYGLQATISRFPYEDKNIKLLIYFSSIGTYDNAIPANYTTLVKIK